MIPINKWDDPSFSIFRESYTRLSSLMHAQNCWFLALEYSIARTLIWISSWKLYFSPRRLPGLNVAWLAQCPCRAQDCLLPASFSTLAGKRRARLVGGAGTILPCCWSRSCWCLRRGLRRRHKRCSLVELISFADAPPAGLVQTKLRFTLQAHDYSLCKAFAIA